MLTNWKTIKVPINKLLEYEENKSSGQLESVIKKEAVMLEKEMKKLSLVFDGVKDMKGLPDAIFVIDVENEKIAVQEAQKMGIPVYGLVDTNSNPKNLTNFVPINDDSSKTIKFVLNLLAEASASRFRTNLIVLDESSLIGTKFVRFLGLLFVSTRP